MEQIDLRSNYSEHPIRLILDVTSSGNLTHESTLSPAKEWSKKYCRIFLLKILDKDFMIFCSFNGPPSQLKSQIRKVREEYVGENIWDVLNALVKNETDS